MNLFDEQQYEFAGRHIGPNESETSEMLRTIGIDNLDALIDKTVPTAIRLKNPLKLPVAQTEFEYLDELKKVAAKKQSF